MQHDNFTPGSGSGRTDEDSSVRIPTRDISATWAPETDVIRIMIGTNTSRVGGRASTPWSQAKNAMHGSPFG